MSIRSRTALLLTAIASAISLPAMAEPVTDAVHAVNNASTHIAWLTPTILLCLVGFVCGTISQKLANKKHYKGYFWTGFFLGIIGLIYVAGLPALPKPAVDRKQQPTII